MDKKSKLMVTIISVMLLVTFALAFFYTQKIPNPLSIVTFDLTQDRQLTLTLCNETGEDVFPGNEQWLTNFSWYVRLSGFSHSINIGLLPNSAAFSANGMCDTIAADLRDRDAIAFLSGAYDMKVTLSYYLNGFARESSASTTINLAPMGYVDLFVLNPSTSTVCTTGNMIDFTIHNRGEKILWSGNVIDYELSFCQELEQDNCISAAWYSSGFVSSPIPWVLESTTLSLSPLSLLSGELSINTGDTLTYDLAVDYLNRRWSQHTQAAVSGSIRYRCDGFGTGSDLGTGWWFFD